MEYTYIDRIKQIKSEKKITNDRLSEMTDIPLGTLSKILAGISDSPKLSNIVAICAALDCSVDYILTHKLEDGTGSTETAELRRLCDYIIENVDYKMWYAGHWHQYKKGGDKLLYVYDVLISLEEPFQSEL